MNARGFPVRLNFFFCSEFTRPPVGLTQPHIQWLPGVKQLCYEVSMVRMGAATSPNAIRLHGVHRKNILSIYPVL